MCNIYLGGKKNKIVKYQNYGQGHQRKQRVPSR